ncbi:MAG: M16 family metallopeptidase [Planctomycetota bacterium]
MKRILCCLILVIWIGGLYISTQDKREFKEDKKQDWMEVVTVTHFKEGIARYTFKNGMRVLLKEDHTVPLIYVMGIFKVGSLYEGEKINSGLSHILEHMAFKGTVKKDAQAIQKEIQEIGGSNNAFTTRTRTGYYIVARSQFIDKALQVLKEQLMESIIDDKELEKEKDVVIKELEDDFQDPWSFLYSQIYLPFAYPDSHSKYTVGGDIHENKKVTRDELIEYYKRYYNPNRFILGITGDFKEEEVLQILKKLFKEWEPHYVPEVYIPEENPPAANRELIVEFENLKGNAKFILSFWKKKFSTVKEQLAFDILSEIIAGGRSSRLHTKLVEEEKVLSDISFFCDAEEKEIHCSADGTVIKPDDLFIAKEKLLNALHEFTKNPPTPEEFEKVLKGYALSQARSLESPFSVLRGIISGEFAENNPVLFLRIFDDLKKVKLEDVINAAKEIFTDDLKYVFTAIVPPGYRSKFEEMQTAKKGTGEIQVEKLNNGIEMVVRHNPSYGYGSVILVFKDSGYWNQNKEKAGLISLTFELLRRGTKIRDRKTIDNEFEKLGTSLSLEGFTSEGHLGYRFSVLKDDLDKALELASDIILNPSFPQDEFNKIKELFISSIKESNEEPFTLISKLFKRRFYRDHLYGFYPSVKTIKSITLEDTKSVYNTFIKPDKFLVVTSGPWTVADIKPLIEKHFGGWQGISKKVEIKEPQQPLKGYVFMKKKGLKTTTVLIAYRGPSYTDKERFAGTIFSYILEPPSVGGRLFNRIRDKEGLAYGVWGSYSPSLFSGVIQGTAQIDAKNVKKVLRLFKDEFSKFKKGEVNEKEIKDAITALENVIYRSLTTNSSYVELLATYKLFNKPLDYYKQVLEEVKKVTKEDVVSFAKKYLDHSKALVLVLYPAQKKRVKNK